MPPHRGIETPRPRGAIPRSDLLGGLAEPDEPPALDDPVPLQVDVADPEPEPRGRRAVPRLPCRRDRTGEIPEGLTGQEGRMGIDWYQNVLEFQRKFQLEPVGGRPASPSAAIVTLRFQLMAEEFEEIHRVMQCGDLPGVAESLADLIYVAIGTAVAYGIDLRPVWDAVHAATMAKDGGSTRPGRKVMRPSGLAASDIAGILGRQEPLA